MGEREPRSPPKVHCTHWRASKEGEGEEREMGGKERGGDRTSKGPLRPVEAKVG